MIITLIDSKHQSCPSRFRFWTSPYCLMVVLLPSWGQIKCRALGSLTKRRHCCTITGPWIRLVDFFAICYVLITEKLDNTPNFVQLKFTWIVIAKIQMKFISICDQVNNTDISLTTAKIVKIFSETNIFGLCAGTDNWHVTSITRFTWYGINIRITFHLIWSCLI